MERILKGLDPDASELADPLRYLKFIQRECSRCGDIVKNLLLFARNSGSEMRTVSLRDLVERSLMLVHHHLEISGIRQEVHFDLEDPEITADAGQIEQALIALMINAVEAMEGSEGTLTLRVAGDSDEIRPLRR